MDSKLFPAFYTPPPSLIAGAKLPALHGRLVAFYRRPAGANAFYRKNLFCLCTIAQIERKFVLFLCNIGAILLALRAAARVAKFQKNLKDLDWEAVAKITGDIGSVKRSIQQVNNRINGMETSKSAAQDALAQVQAAQLKQVTPFRGGG